ncbi:hypothetical protein [Metabacillus bambusae]|uniref:Rod shape-determining protein MreD n=1 Tax=Metabacillus bambusae TaxID=2795218 RepID=A0ABS3N1K9_9BACI|nr:hypothetical protein [Metabacillus bambusae]MBO1512146.1 hypothetical protein [Metabacillus bambusae]
MRNTKLFMILMSLLPWLSVPLLNAKTFKRFLPSVLFMCLYVASEGYLAQKKKWWWFPLSVKPNVVGELPLIFGPFFVGSFWILKYTYGKFNLYLLINIVIDSIFTYFTLNFFKKIGYVSLVRLTKFQLSLLFLVKSVLMYGFQVMYEKYFYQDTYEN